MKIMIFGNTIFLGGIISLTLILTSPNGGYLGDYAALMLGLSLTGFVIMVLSLIGKERLKGFFQSKYDITGKAK